MNHKTKITLLVFAITTLAILVTTVGIFSNQGTGKYEYQSIRNKTITIYGKGVYHDMSAEVAPQGIAQDYVRMCNLNCVISSLLYDYPKGFSFQIQGHPCPKPDGELLGCLPLCSGASPTFC